MHNAIINAQRIQSFVRVQCDTLEVLARIVFFILRAGDTVVGGAIAWRETGRRVSPAICHDLFYHRFSRTCGLSRVTENARVSSRESTFLRRD